MGRSRARWHALARVTAYLVIIWVVQFYGGALALEQAHRLIPDLLMLDRPDLITRWPALLLSAVWLLIATVLVTWVATRLLDRRPLVDLGLRWKRGEAANVLFGLGLGVALMSAFLGLELVLGWARVLKWSADLRTYQPAFVGVAGSMVLMAIAEELTFRGYILRNLTEAWSRWPAAAVSALLFAGAHSTNPGFDPVAQTLLFGAGLMLASAYFVQESLWLPLALHLSWNVTEGLVYGYPVSGLHTPKALLLRTKGPPLLTGGEFGPEGGLLLLPLLALAIVVLELRRRRLASRPGAGG